MLLHRADPQRAGRQGFRRCEVQGRGRYRRRQEGARGSDVEAIKAAGESLQSVAYELAQVVYADAQQQTDGAAGAQPADDDVVDADYEVVDDEDK